MLFGWMYIYVWVTFLKSMFISYETWTVSSFLGHGEEPLYKIWESYYHVCLISYLVTLNLYYPKD